MASDMDKDGKVSVQEFVEVGMAEYKAHAENYDFTQDFEVGLEGHEDLSHGHDGHDEHVSQEL